MVVSQISTKNRLYDVLTSIFSPFTDSSPMSTMNASEYRPSRHRQNKCNENISTTCLIYLKFWSICPSEENGFSHEFIAPIKDEKTFSPKKHSVSAAGD